MNLTIASLKTHSLTHVKNVLLQNNVECKFLFTNTTITQLHILHDTIFWPRVQHCRLSQHTIAARITLILEQSRNYLVIRSQETETVYVQGETLYHQSFTIIPLLKPYP